MRRVVFRVGVCYCYGDRPLVGPLGHADRGRRTNDRSHIWSEASPTVCFRPQPGEASPLVAGFPFLGVSGSVYARRVGGRVISVCRSALPDRCMGAKRCYCNGKARVWGCCVPLRSCAGYHSGCARVLCAPSFVSRIAIAAACWAKVRSCVCCVPFCAPRFGEVLTRMLALAYI